MSGYTVLANRFRPRRFQDVVGQEDTARVLSAAIAGGRAAHAFLFAGPRGVGKTSMARILAKALDCLERDDGQSCDRCRVCTAIDAGQACMDVVEIDGASHNKVENVRDLIENLRFRPAEARYRVVIVDEVHMLSTAAFNALLKTLEEPPAHAKFILATTELLKVPETIRSRCQLFEFRRLSAVQITERLASVCVIEGVEVPEGLLPRIARHAQGGLRDALTLLDQLVTFGAGKPSVADFERLTGRLSPELLGGLVEAALAGDGARAHAALETALCKGARPGDLVDQLGDLLEGLLVVAVGGEPADRTPEERAALSALAAGLDVDRLLAMLDVIVEAGRRLRQRADGRLVVEMAVLNLARTVALRPLADLLAGRVDAPPAGRRAQAPAPAAPSAPAPPAGPARAAAPSSPEPLHPGPAHSDPAFRERFLAAVGQRSLRLELARYPRIELQGDECVLVAPANASQGLFDPASGALREVLHAAAERAAGRPVRVRVAAAEGSGGAARAPAPPASSPGPSAHATQDRAAPVARQGTGPVQQLWPDAEPVDP